MKAVELDDATEALSEYAKQACNGTLVVIRRGKPLAAVVPVAGLDWEDLVVGSDPDFIALIERSRRLYKPGTGIPLEELRRRYGVVARPARKRAPRDRRRSR